MERTEPTFVPEWLKNSGGFSTTSHQLASSSLQSDEQGVSKSVRNKSLDNVLDRGNSSNFRRESVNHGSARLRSYSSFNRNRRDRDRVKDISEFRNKEKLDNRHHDYSDPLVSILPNSRFEKNGLRRSHSGISGKRGESWPKKAQNNGGSLPSVNVKTSFERDFPTLGGDEKQNGKDIGRVSSPGLSSAIESLPVGNSAGIGGNGWTSALAEVPATAGSNANGSSAAPLVQRAPVSATSGMTSGRNMAEAVAHGPPRTETPPQLTVGSQRLEELAVKQSRQLIPVTPSMPKALGSNSSDRQKLKTGQSQFQSSHIINNPNSSRSLTVKPDVSKAGKLLVLKPSRERNGATPTAKDSLSPTAAKLPDSPLAVPSVVAPAPLKNPGNGPTVANVEKRPSLQAQSRSNFFNLMRKKSMTSSSSSVTRDPSPSGVNNGEPVDPEGGLGSAMVPQSSETKVEPVCNGKNHSGPDVILYSEEEEARFLRSLGWEETAEEEEEGLTEEEISSFYQNYMSLKPDLKISKTALQKLDC